MGVLRATRELLDSYSGEALSARRRSRLVSVVLRFGSRPDARALLPAFLDDAEHRPELVPVFARHGNASTAARLLDRCVTGGRLRPDASSEVLHAVGYLGHEPAERVLWGHLEDDWAASRDACLGLLHLPCREVGPEIAAALERYRDESVFPEFLPVLAVKTGDPSWRGRLVDWGERRASVDCNGGLVLGVALHGAAAREDFVRLLWDRRWEADGPGTGTSYWAYAGARVQDLRMSDLYADLVARLTAGGDADQRRHEVHVLITLARHHATAPPWLGVRAAHDPDEDCAELYDLLFERSAGRDPLPGLVARVFGHRDPLVGALNELEGELELRAAHEAEIRTVGAPGPG